MENMHEFFETTFQGIYCTLCNADNHKFFSVD